MRNIINSLSLANKWDVLKYGKNIGILTTKGPANGYVENFIACLFSTAPATKEVYDREKRHCNVCTLGFHGHGKTTLSAAITKILHDKNLCKLKNIEDIDNHPKEKKEGLSVQPTKFDYFTEKRHFAHWDCPGHHNYIKSAIPVALEANGAIFVASANDDELSDTTNALHFIKNVGIKHLVVYANKIDVAKTKPDSVVEMIRKLLISLGFDSKTPIITGSALAALKETDTTHGKDSIVKLLEAIEEHIPVPDPTHCSDKPFIVPIDHVYSIKNVGTIVSGTVEQGTIRKGMEAEIVGYGKQIPTKISGLETFEKIMPEACKGDHAFALLERVSRSDVNRGMVLSERGACKIYDHCEVEVQVLTEEEGGRGTPVNNFFDATVYSKTWDTLACVLTPDKNEIKPGEKANIRLHLNKPMVLDVGSRFVFLANNKIVGSGRVNKVLPDLTDDDKLSVFQEKKQKKKEKKAKEKAPEFQPHNP